MKRRAILKAVMTGIGALFPGVLKADAQRGYIGAAFWSEAFKDGGWVKSIEEQPLQDTDMLTVDALCKAVEAVRKSKLIRSGRGSYLVYVHESVSEQELIDSGFVLVEQHGETKVYDWR